MKLIFLLIIGIIMLSLTLLKILTNDKILGKIKIYLSYIEKGFWRPLDLSRKYTEKQSFPLLITKFLKLNGNGLTFEVTSLLNISFN